jgi:deoxyxylulose-5-phosphate synthase
LSTLTLPQEFLDHGSRASILAGLGLDAAGIAAHVHTLSRPHGKPAAHVLR